MIAVHGGAGFYMRKEHTICAESLRNAKDVIEAVKYLELNPCFNCGVGSNLTSDGQVECEAGFMTSYKYRFGAVGAVSRIVHVSELAHSLAMDIGVPGLVKPNVLVGVGAEKWALEKGFKLVDNDYLKTEYMVDKWQTINRMFRQQDDKVMPNIANITLDTVGAVSIQDNIAEACTSSGGIYYKRPGRLGHSTVFGSGMWAESSCGIHLAISVSGCGEAIVRTDFCRSLAREYLKKKEDMLPLEVVTEWFDKQFLESPMLNGIEPEHKLAGGIIMIQDMIDDQLCDSQDSFKKGRTELVVFHNTKSLPFAYRTSDGCIKKKMSKLSSIAKFQCESYVI